MRTGLLTATAVLVWTLAGAGSASSGAAVIGADIPSLVASRGWFIRLRPNDHGASRALPALYAKAGNVPLWVRDGQPTPQALALLRLLGSADAWGLESTDYGAKRLAVLAGITPAAGGTSITGARRPDDWGMFDLDLSAAAMKFISDLHYGRIDPRAVGFDLGVRRPDDLDLGAAVRVLAATDDVTRELAAIEPQFLHYQLLKRALVRYRALAAEEPTPAARRRVRQIDLTLERWRWLPAFQTPPIIVNIPEFRLFAFRTTTDHAADILQMDVIVGRTFPRTRTPVFVADMKSVLFRPYWDVPRSITVREMLPKIRAKSDFLIKEHLDIVRGTGDSVEVLPPTPLSILALTNGTARLRQRPGPDNALGLIKFDLPNRYDVYLHSTPVQQLFRNSRRAFSHGCIRVSDPAALAAYVLRDTAGGAWTPERIETAANGTETRRVRLAHPIRVMVLYGTVLAKENGEVLFFSDLYGQDRSLERLLGLEPIRTGP